MLEKPGVFPYTRGIYPEMYRKRLWTMRQYAGFGSAVETNQRFHYLLAQGQTGLSTAFDLPTQLGYDSDHAFSKYEVGKVGVPISSTEDMEQLLKKIPLDEVSLSMTINAPAAILLAMVLAIADKRKISWKKLRGTIQNDILKEYIARGTYIFPPRPSLKLAADTIAFVAKQVPLWHPISISGYHIREAGATAAEELALTLSHAQTYIEATLKTGLTIDQFAPTLSFFFCVGNDFFEEIAKFRAARTLWAQIIRKKYKAKKKESEKLRFHAQTSGVSLTAQQPENNVVRTTYQTLAAILGGAQSLHTNAMNEALSLPTEESAKLALRTQQIIAFETGIPKVADPLGGSHYIEDLTKQLEKKTLELMKKIEKAGGALKAVESGLSKKMIESSATQYQQQVEQNKKTIIGVNAFCDGEETKIPLHQHQQKEEKKQIQALKQFKKNRNSKKIDSLLRQLQTQTENGENLLPHFVECVKNKVTVGEICGVLRQVYGEYH